jgi:hypothetical protein
VCIRALPSLSLEYFGSTALGKTAGPAGAAGAGAVSPAATDGAGRTGADHPSALDRGTVSATVPENAGRAGAADAAAGISPGSGSLIGSGIIPADDADATHLGANAPPDWQPGRWILIVENAAGETREAFRITQPAVTVGRRASDPGLRPTIAIGEAPHVSRRQLVLVWESRGEEPGFRVYNLGLNEIRIAGGRAIPGARAGRTTPLDSPTLKAVSEENTGWLPPGERLRIGEHGPFLRIDEIPEGPDDPDATVFE